MSSTRNLEELFKNWNDLNNKVESSFGKLDFNTIKKIRNKQRDIEDKIYRNVLNNAAEGLKKILPEDCGEMEVGFELKSKRFYFLMEDPEQSNDGPMRILAITIDTNKKIEIIKDFQRKE
jgi:hypothetical protein